LREIGEIEKNKYPVRDKSSVERKLGEIGENREKQISRQG
jgi:hypothetical protein